jgi:hypothetical protein
MCLGFSPDLSKIIQHGLKVPHPSQKTSGAILPIPFVTVATLKNFSVFSVEILQGLHIPIQVGSQIHPIAARLGFGSLYDPQADGKRFGLQTFQSRKSCDV